MNEEMYVQCRLEQDLGSGRILMDVAYIPEYGAKVGNKVELKGEEGLWEVKTVCGKPTSISKIREKQSADRKQRQASDI